MPQFEYKVVPAPRKGEKSKGAKTTPDRFALALTLVMNDLGRDGWEYLRADTLPCDERVGLTGSKTAFQNMLVFRREIGAEAALSFVRAAPDPQPAPIVLRARSEGGPTPPLGTSTPPAANTAAPVGPATGLAAE